MKPRERLAAALEHDTLDRCPFRASFTPEFSARLRLLLARTPNVQRDTPLDNFRALVNTAHNTPYPR